VPPKISTCRLCGWAGLRTVVDLGTMAYTGYFPKPGEVVPEGPLEIVECESCRLAQLAHEYDPAEMYGPTYGYRSGLNPSMVEHLRGVALDAWKYAKPEAGDLVVDIGANDGTLLGFYPDSVKRIAIDPLCEKYADHYKPGIARAGVPYTPSNGIAFVGYGQAKIVTTIACFYDFADPVGVARSIYGILRDGGVWIIECATAESITSGAWDQINHEHTLYLGIRQLVEIIERADLRIIGYGKSDVNGGSVRIVCQKGGRWPAVGTDLKWGNGFTVWGGVQERIDADCAKLRHYLESAKRDGRRVIGYGASTKGNAVLQRAGVTPELIDEIVDVNPDKIGSVTPGTGIPIAASSPSPSAYLVLPWHFEKFIVEKEREFLQHGGELIFALPKFHRVTRNGSTAA
jgi:hypothetical protein